jgi:hypothetical protein
VGGRARAGSAEQGSGGRGGRDREVGEAGAVYTAPLIVSRDYILLRSFLRYLDGKKDP